MISNLLERRREMLLKAETIDPYLLQPFTVTFQQSANLVVCSVGGSNTPTKDVLKININNTGWVSGTESGGLWYFNGSYLIAVQAGDILQMISEGPWSSGSARWVIDGESQTRCTLSGNINSLVYGDDFIGKTELPNNALTDIFYYDGVFSSSITDAENLRLPATTIGNSCYAHLFRNASLLVHAPELPATVLGGFCYQYMFYGCSSLVKAPDLPATDLEAMCYTSMFTRCTTLTEAPELPATTLANSCYSNMFYGCTNITKAPDLPALTLVSSCYNQMFQGCSKLNYIKAMFTTTPSTSYTRNWVRTVANTGTFVKNSAATWNVSGTNGIPTNWTVQTASS